MKIVIFAGGTGTRLWPLSRKNSPKQFDKLINGKSTLQMAIERVKPVFGLYNVYIQTLESYVSTIKEQVPELPLSNIFAEPEKRDVGPAIGFAFMKLRKQNINEPIAIIWSDHLMERPKAFQEGLKLGEKLILENPERFVHLAEEPRYAENNVGWVKIGKKIDERKKTSIHKFKGWWYRPPLKKCKQMFQSGNWLWNPGYWITSIDFVLSLYKKFQPEMYTKLKKMANSFDTDQESAVVAKIYPTMHSIHFDNAIMDEVNHSEMIVLRLDMGWSDPGTLYALKEAQQKSLTANVTKGKTLALNCKDCLIYNQEKNKLVSAVGLNGMVVVNTKDASVVVHKDAALDVRDLVAELEKRKMGEYL
ncbi:hypothetical protein KJ596_01140 [Patescibacteria group bacterium]|nr:hypothetical protein [Patescibacteria group bacterium]MBU1868124.1 hypothetical protein [Patescibacteria group bacterium]